MSTINNKIEYLYSNVEQYYEKLCSITFRDLRHVQEIPWASLTGGIGGLIYTLIYDAPTKENNYRSLHAQALLNDLLLHADDNLAYNYTDLLENQWLNTSFFASQDAVLFLNFVIRYRLNQSYENELNLLFETINSKPQDCSTELIHGLSGYLNIALHIYKMTKSPDFRKLSDTIANYILDSGTNKTKDSWTNEPTLNFFHGRAGVIFSLLQHAQITQRDLPEWLFGELENLIAILESSPTYGMLEENAYIMHRSCCKGSAGYAIMWIKAYELTGLQIYGHRAWRAASFAHTGLNSSVNAINLCCGLGGRAYALLALDRAFPNCGWYEKALELCYEAIKQISSIDSFFTKGLFNGYSGLICLVQDILSPYETRKGYPLIEIS